MEKLDPKGIANILALTPVQEGMLFHYLQDPQAGLYFEQLSLKISGEMNLRDVEEAWNVVIKTNEMLRTVFRWETLEKPSQIILKEHQCKVVFHDLGVKDQGQTNPALAEIKKKDRLETFDLHQVPFRVILCKLAEKKYEMIISNHHILYDGWSNGIILKEFFKAYHRLSQGAQTQKIPAKPLFKEFIKWIQSQDRNKQEQYWKEYLAGFEGPLELPIKKKTVETAGMGEYSIILDAGLSRKLDVYVKNNRVTLASVFYAAWGILLQKYGGGEDVVFGTTVSGRSVDVKGIEDMVGLFINTIPFRTQTIPVEKIGNLVFQTEHVLRAREAFENTPLVDIRSYGSLASSGPLFDTIMAIENYPLDNRLVPGGCLLAIDSYSMSETGHYDLSVGITLLHEIKIDFSYRQACFDKEAIENLAGHFKGIIQAIIEKPGTELSQLEIISTEEKHRLLYDFNNTAKEYPADKTIHQLFAEQASKTPDHIALIGAGPRVCPSPVLNLTYRQLNEQGGRVAGWLIEKGVQPDSIVGIMMERSVEMVIGIFGILKSGGAYLPIDPEYPQDRIDYMLKDSAAKILINKSEIRNSKLETNPNSQKINDQNKKQHFGAALVLDFEHLNFEFVSNFGFRISNFNYSNLAYIIYTSGSTGKPKGVMVQHENLVNAAFGWREEYRLDKIDVNLLQMASYSFDVSCGDLCRALLNGGKLFICPDDLKLNFPLLYNYLCIYRITLFESTPSLVVPLMDYIYENRLKPDYLQLLIIGSDSFRSTDYQRLRARYGKSMRIINSYGVTEATIDSTYYESDDGGGIAEFVPIGRPMANVKCFIFDAYCRIQPVGVPGELVIAGSGIARGYANRPELTAEKFRPQITLITQINKIEKAKIMKSFSGGPGGRFYKKAPLVIYKTGDLARWLPDKTSPGSYLIEFLGRIDHQVKIRGFRIELGEIENRLLEHEAVKDAVVIERTDPSGDKFLAAYIAPIVKKPGEVINKLQLAENIREYLTGKLPGYMIPSYFILLEKLPLTPNGKLDKKSLPLLSENSLAGTIETFAPRSAIEIKLAGLWSHILGIKQEVIGIDADFFRLGGHSLKITRLAAGINRELGMNLSLTQLFKLTTIRAQARYLAEIEQQKQKTELISLPPLGIAPMQEYYDLSYAQRRLWIICQFEEDSIAYNEIGGLAIKGKFNPSAFEKAMRTIAQRHEILRTIFVTIDGEPKQKILPEVELKLEQEDLRYLKGEEKGEEKGDRQETGAALIIKNTANKAFNLEKGPLAVFKLLQLEDERYFLLVNIHHIINDGWSVGVIKNELNTLYNYFNKNLSGELPLAPVIFQYKDYTMWHNGLIKNGYFDKYKDYWLEKFKDKPTGIELPLDHPRGAVQTFNGGRIYYTIEELAAAKLRELTNKEETTIFMKLMALLSILLHKYSGENDIIMGSPIAGRKQPELHHMIGFLVNTLVYRMNVEPGESFGQLLAQVKEETLACYENQDYPFDILVENLGLARDMSRSPLFNVMMAFGDADTAGEDIHFDWTEVRFHEQIEGFDPAVFDLVFFFNENGKRLDCEIMYNSDLFGRSTIERMANNFLTLVKHGPENINKPIFDLEYIEKEEYKTIVRHFNDNEKEFLPMTIQELVERQVEKSLNRVAVVSPEGWAITYAEINQRANHLAHYLRQEYHMGPGKVIGICIERSIEMIIAVLGVVKSGAAYLSFDPNYPQDRVKHMIADSRAGLVISDQSRPDLFESGQTLLDIHALSGKSLQNPQIQNELSDAVYVIYTSGSTGTPNGAMLSQALLSNLIQWQAADTGIDGSLRCLQFTSINFCVSFQEIFTTLSSGGEVHLIGDIERQDIEYLMQFLAQRKIGNLYLPFSYLNFLFNLSSEASTVTYLQHIITAGEQLKITGGLKKFLDQHPHIKLHNHYGSSEMHVVTSFTLDAATASLMPVPPAGKPIANTRIYILDENEKPVPIGVWGELFVDGSSQVLGYIHNPVLTDKKLVWHPGLSQLSGHRLYRSGDVGRWLEDGNIELKGRKDFQVKIRGFRVEPSEIESKILALDKVKDCVVVVKENTPGEKILVAYVVSSELDVSEIKRHLGSYLPQYMIPKFMVLESLPLMPNGKVDREKLPPLPEPPAKRPDPLITALREQIKDFDHLPIPDRSLVNYDKYGQNIGLAMVRHTVSLQASRGCPYNCLYCHKIWPKKHVFRSAENIFAEVELYYQMGVRRFVLVDDIFNLDVQNSSRFFEMVIKKDLNAQFFFPNGLRSDILTKDYIDLMAAGGTKGIGMALESASPRIQRLLKKNLDLDKLRENAEYLCKKHPEIILELFLMHGFPTETEKEAVMTLDFLKALHWIDFPYLHILKIFPHTDMAAMAMENGVSEEAIARSAGLAFHELPETLPFAKSFTLKYQAEFLGDYFLLKERLLSRLPQQMKVLTPEELVEKYNSYLPVEIKTVNDVLEFAGIEPGLLEKPDENEIMTNEKVQASDLDAKIRKHFIKAEPRKNALRILLLDLSQFFSDGKKILYDGVEPPLGLMYLLTYLKKELGARVNGKIAKSRVDFDSFEELKVLLEEFKPHVLGIRTLTYYSRFFHEVVANIRQWGFTGPVIAGGPYATSDYTTILKDPHVDVVVLSEGELTFAELVTGIIANQGQLPGDEGLREIAGLAFVPGNRAGTRGEYQGVFSPDEWSEGGLPGVLAAAVGQKVRFENEVEEKLAGIWAELLGIEKGMIGREDNFFELGGHSLKATTLMTRIHKEFHVRVKLIEIFKAPTIRDVAALIAGVSQEHFVAIEPVEKKEYYRISSAQKRMYILQQMDEKNTGYNMTRVMELEGHVDIKHLEQAVQKLVEHHEAFRTSFHLIADEVTQIIQNKSFAELFQKRLPEGPPEAIIKTFIRPFDLSCAPLLRVGLVELTENRHLLMVDMHHIISDGVSIEIMINDFVSFYNGAQLPVMRVQYKDYAEWQQAEKPGGTLLEQKAYWQAQFEGEIPVLELPTDYKRPEIQSFAGNTLNFEIDSESTGALKALALGAGATLYMTLVALYSIFLTKISGQEDIAIGTPVAGRPHADLEKIIGMFVNTLALRSYPVGEKKFSEFLGEIKKMTLGAFENQDFQYEDLVEEIGATRDAGRNPLFDVLFVLQNAGRGIIQIPGLKIKTNEQENLTSKFDLSLVAAEVEDKLSFTFEYSTQLFKQVTIERFKVYFKNVLNVVINNKEQKIADIEVITEAEKRRLLFDFNNTEITYPLDKTIPQLFTEQVERTPDGIALVGAGPRVCPSPVLSLTYRQLNEKSAILAGLLIEKGVQWDSIVGIMVERTLEMIVGILGILKAGAAYLPIDPDYPPERIDYMLKDSEAKILLTDHEKKKMAKCQLSIVNCKLLMSAPRTVFHHSSHLAYVIYTSGSTGKPKGVLVEHRNVVRLVKNPNFIETKEGQHLLLTGAFTFDIVTFEIWWPLLNGLSLYLPDKSTIIEPLEMGKMVSVHRIDILHLVPQLFKQLFSHNAEIFAGLSYFLIGGDQVSPQDIRELRNNYKKLKILHMYGPTENTTFSTYREVDKVGEHEESLSIGMPVNNSTVYILGRHDELLPMGVVGQICTGGAGVARGYLNNPELTNDKFRVLWANFHHSSFIIHHPVLYRTGDLGRWIPDSTALGAYKLEFLGRIDQQVKIRGFRIELGEIENRLSRYPGITGCVVTAGERKSGEKYMCAYFTAGEKLEITGIRDYLGLQLPIYMIPAYFIQLEKIPLNLHGKLAKERLPVPEAITEAKKTNNFVAPQSNLEKIIATLWKETLELDNICIDDNFFELGGNSLNIVTVNLRLREQLAADISVMMMFRYPTIRTLATYLEQNKDNFNTQKKEIFGAIDRAIDKSKSKLRTELKKEKEEIAETGFDIAVIGMAGRFPGARNVEEFWHNLKNGIESITFFSDRELLEAGCNPDKVNQPNYVKAMGYLQDIEYFDSAFFGYGPAESELIDPQIRIFHECAWETLEDAGYDPGTYPGRIGIYAGGESSTFWETLTALSELNPGIDSLTMSSLNNKDFLSMRISYKFNLSGPAFTIHTACSTSLVSIHLAVQALLNGECEMALAGGVRVSTPGKAGYLYEEGMISSPDGHCRAFDAGAKGTVAGDGVGLVLLKSIEEATAGGDHIYAVIKGSAINNDGLKKVGFHAPSIEGQAEVISAALYTSGVEPESIGYIETHGTGTELGDSVEIEALKLSFNANNSNSSTNSNQENSCALGSVKTNVGHLGCAAGVTGFIKTVLILKHQLIPPSLHFEKPNPKIDFENSPFYVNTQLKAWPETDFPARAGVSSFGIGGTNAHIVLEAAPSRRTLSAFKESDRPYQLLLLSARTPAVLEKMMQNLANYLKENSTVSLADTAHTLQAGRKRFTVRQKLLCADTAQAIAMLTGNSSSYTAQPVDENRKIIFMFPGLGPQYINMGEGLYRSEPFFREEMDRCFELLKLLGYDIKEIIYNRTNGSDSTHINEITMAQMAIFIFEYALAKLIMHWGIRPHGMIGYSFGEYVAACLAGVFSLEDTLKLLAARGKLISRLPAGTMLSVPLPVADVLPLIPGELSMGIDNGSSCVVSGPAAAVASFAKKMKENKVLCNPFESPYAAHSQMLDPLLEEFKKEVAKITLNPPQIPYISTVTGNWIDGDDVQVPEYWVKQLRSTVYFVQGIRKIQEEAQPLFLEIGPGRDMSALVNREIGETGDKKAQQALSLVKHRGVQKETTDEYYLLDKIGRLWLYGVNIDWQAFHSDYSQRKRYRVSLPTYPFERQRYWKIIDDYRTGKYYYLKGAPGYREKNIESADLVKNDHVPQAPGSIWYPRPQLSTFYVAPKDEIQQTLVGIWQHLFGIEEIGIRDDFFELGGDSLKAINVLANLHKETNRHVPLNYFFDNPTIEQVAAYFEADEKKFISIQPLEKKEYYPMSSAQKRMYFFQQVDLDSIAYNNVLANIIEGDIDTGKLSAIFKKLIARHEGLRTSFIEVNGQLVQRIHDSVEFEITGSCRGDLLIKNFIRPFDLTKAPLLRIGLLNQILIVDMHHIISDGTSLAVLIEEFMVLYQGAELPALPLQYKDYAVWQDLEKEGVLERQRDFWLSEFAGEIPVLNLPYDYARPVVRSFSGKTLTFEVGREETSALNQMASGQGATLYMSLLCLTGIFLAKLSGDESVVVGTPIAGRTHADLGRIIGMFVNTLAMKIEPVGEKTVSEFLAEVKEKALNAFANQDYQYEELVEHLAVDRSSGRNPLFDTLFALQNVQTSSIAVPDLNLKPYPYEQGIAKFDLSFQCFENGDALSFTLEYSTELFKDETAQKLAGYLKKILSSLVEKPTEKIAGIELISQEEKEQILLQFNDTASAYPADKTIHQLFAEQAARTPDRLALVGADLRVCPNFSGRPINLTYRQLNEQAGRVAGWLIEKGVLPDNIVGIMMERSVEMIIGIIGILKAGGAYLPIDPEYPKERIAYMLKDSGARILIKSEIRNPKFETNPNDQIINNQNKNFGIPFVLNFENLNFEFVSNFDIRASNFNSSNLAYLIYTSGSTGKPKGVLITHRNVVRLVKNTNYIDFAIGDSILQTGAMEFDASTFEVWGALLNGLKLVLVNKETILTPAKLKASLHEYNISTIWMTSPLFNQMLQEDIEIFAGLKNLLVGGDVLSPSHIGRLKSKYPRLKIINGYGPTENTTFSTTFPINAEYLENIPIGNPIANSTAYIVDKDNHLQPIGIPGELLVGGDGVARGYLNNPELTAKCFIRPSATRGSFKKPPLDPTKFLFKHHLLYKTGDLARWLPDGNIEFLGRIDQQVKIRGFRIEPGEIENLLLKHDRIKNALVAVKADDTGDKSLTAYIVSDTTLADTELKDYLLKDLPAYMIPGYFMQLANIPLTANKKIDFRALPEPGKTTGRDYIAPGDDVEKQLAEIWAWVLGIEKDHIGINSDFFGLGGHSLKATSLAAHLNKEMKVSVPLMEIFKTPTIKGLSKYIKSTQQVVPVTIEAVEKMEYYQPSPVQKRLVALQLREPDVIVYNIPLILILEGKPDTKKLEWTFKQLIQRHESLRTSFHMVDGQPVQRIHDRVDFENEYYDLAPQEETEHPDEEQIIKDFIRPFDLSQAPLMRVGLLKTGNETHILMIDMHHIITDGSSQAILINEFSAIYLGKELAPLTIQHKDYTNWQSLQRTGPRMQQLETYWFNAFTGAYPELKLPYDYPRTLAPDYSGAHIDFVLAPQHLQGLRKLGDAHGATLFMVLLAVFNVLLSKISGQVDIVVGTPTAGRKHADLENISGLFVSSLALRNNPAGEKNFRDFLIDVKERTAADFEHQDYSVEDLLKKVNENREKKLGHLYNVMLVLQNMDTPGIAIPSLTLKAYPVKSDTAKYELVLICSETDGRLFYTFEYRTRLFKHETMLQFESYFKKIILTVLANPEQRLCEITTRLKEK